MSWRGSVAIERQIRDLLSFLIKSRERVASDYDADGVHNTLTGWHKRSAVMEAPTGSGQDPPALPRRLRLDGPAHR
jgi:hypothetical protein